ncbi:MAG: lamin tail domain-containing protein, partial [Chitinophagales bacterium]
MKYIHTLLRYAILAVVFSLGLPPHADAQVVINEAGNRNAGQIADEEGKYEDWIELFNAGTDTAFLLNYGISDNTDEPLKWTFPDVALAPDAFLLLFASGKNRKPNTAVDHWESITNNNTTYKYIVPTASTSSGWKNTGFIPDGDWLSGKASIGYGDSDDSSVVAFYTTTVYARYTFEIADTSVIGD